MVVRLASQRSNRLHMGESPALLKADAHVVRVLKILVDNRAAPVVELPVRHPVGPRPCGNNAAGTRSERETATQPARQRCERRDLRAARLRSVTLRCPPSSPLCAPYSSPISDMFLKLFPLIQIMSIGVGRPALAATAMRSTPVLVPSARETTCSEMLYTSRRRVQRTLLT